MYVQYLQHVRGHGGARVRDAGDDGAAGGAHQLHHGLPRRRHVRPAREGAHHRRVRALPHAACASYV